LGFKRPWFALPTIPFVQTALQATRWNADIRVSLGGTIYASLTTVEGTKSLLLHAFSLKALVGEGKPRLDVARDPLVLRRSFEATLELKVNAPRVARNFKVVVIAALPD
jgi:hypothetical protein